MSSPKKADWPVVAVLVAVPLILAAVIGLYAWSYYKMSIGGLLSINAGGATVGRSYRTELQAQIFKPAAKIESLVTGNRVFTYSLDTP